MLFGQHFMLSPDGNRFGLPAFYSLHAWIWKLILTACSPCGIPACTATESPGEGEISSWLTPGDFSFDCRQGRQVYWYARLWSTVAPSHSRCHLCAAGHGQSCGVWVEIGSRAFGGERGCQTIRSCEYLRTARSAARSPNDPASATLGEAGQRAITQSSTGVEPDRLSVLSADGLSGSSCHLQQRVRRQHQQQHRHHQQQHRRADDEGELEACAELRATGEVVDNWANDRYRQHQRAPAELAATA